MRLDNAARTIAVLAAFASGCGGGDDSRPPTTDRPDAPPPSDYGFVRDWITLAPIPNATVTLYGWDDAIAAVADAPDGAFSLPKNTNCTAPCYFGVKAPGYVDAYWFRASPTSLKMYARDTLASYYTASGLTYDPSKGTIRVQLSDPTIRFVSASGDGTIKYGDPPQMTSGLQTPGTAWVMQESPGQQTVTVGCATGSGYTRTGSLGLKVFADAFSTDPTGLDVGMLEAGPCQ